MLTALGIYIFILVSSDTTDDDVANLLKDYEQLENAYKNVIDGVDDVTDSDSKSIEQLKSELKVILLKLKIEQKHITAQRPKDTSDLAISDPSVFDTLDIGLNQDDIALVISVHL